MTQIPTRQFGSIADNYPIPDLTELQRKSYFNFLQFDVMPHKRKRVGLEALAQEVFPIESFDGSLKLEYLSYELGRSRYNPDECRRLRLTYGVPFKLKLRLVTPNGPIEEDVYLGEIPLMIGGGEFIINGAERVIVTQLHRSPGVDFSVEQQGTERRMHSCWVIPERGSWIELSVSKKDILSARIDQSGKFSAITLLRGMDERFDRNADILREFYPTKKVKLGSTKDQQKKALKDLDGSYVLNDLVDEASGEVFLESGRPITKDKAKEIVASGLSEIEVIAQVRDPLVLESLYDDQTDSHKAALMRIYQRLRPGNPVTYEKAKQLFRERFFDATRYSLGRVGRFRLNRKFRLDIDPDKTTLTPQDYLEAIRYILKLRERDTGAETDDIDHLGNRRVRPIDELASDEFRKGFLKLKRNVQERMNLDKSEQISPRTLVNSKTVSSSIEFFFGRSELSQVVDQTNPLSQLTHERRLSALGPGGLNRKRAGFEVRDVHVSHYGRICPIETPEGTNVGLISSLSIYASVDEYGFLTTPYRVVKKGRVTEDIVYLRADEEFEAVLAPSDITLDKNGHIRESSVLARKYGDFSMVGREEVQYLDVSSRQIVGVSASLIPFLEHDDANRALMGSNMQRQAVPLLITEPPLVGTGMEREVARNSGMVVRAENAGTVLAVDAIEIRIGDKNSPDDAVVYSLRKFVGLNERTCLNQRPIVQMGQRVKKGEVIADGAATSQGELALGKNVMVAFMPWDGFNFEDAVVVSERLLREDSYTSLHIDEFEIEIRETKLGREEFTNDIPNVAEKMLKNLDEHGIVRVGTRVKPGDILIGKVAPKSKSELSPEEKLLHAIFGKSGEDVKNDSLEVPSGVDGIVIGAMKFSRKANIDESERAEVRRKQKQIDEAFLGAFESQLRQMIIELETLIGGKLKTIEGETLGRGFKRNLSEMKSLRDKIHLGNLEIPDPHKEKALELIQAHRTLILNADEERFQKTSKLNQGDELPPGVLEMGKVYIATKRTLSVGDKFAGRHGNKGVVSKILPLEDMPFLEDGRAVDMVLNPLGVPSRMNVGQILETHLGWAARSLGFQAITPVFAGVQEEEIRGALKEAKLPEDGKVTLFDGRTGKPFDQRVTVGALYMMKLHHLVDDKVHARATGPYSLITQQPLGGKARFGGQRFGEMEVWALEAYGAAYVLQELLTIKSDDVDGRTKIYEAMVKGENVLDAGTPVSFEVLTNEIKGLALNIVLERSRGI